jgi:hypothetical protein
MKRKLARMRWKAKNYNLFLWETTITLVSLSGVQVEIRNEHIPNTNVQPYRCNNLFGTLR